MKHDLIYRDCLNPIPVFIADLPSERGRSAASAGPPGSLPPKFSPPEASPPVPVPSLIRS